MTLRDPVTIQQLTESGGSGGASVRTYADLTPHIWARAEYPGGTEFRRAGQVAADVSAIFTIHRHVTVTNKHRFKMQDGTIYDLTYIEPLQAGPYRRVFGRAIQP